jgi:hypothetical protein
MKLISETVGLLRDIIWRGKAVKSSIWKNPVAGRVRAYEKLQQGIWSHNGIFHLVDSWPRTGFVSHGFQVLASCRREGGRLRFGQLSGSDLQTHPCLFSIST